MLIGMSSLGIRMGSVVYYDYHFRMSARESFFNIDASIPEKDQQLQVQYYYFFSNTQAFLLDVSIN